MVRERGGRERDERRERRKIEVKIDGRGEEGI